MVFLKALVPFVSISLALCGCLIFALRQVAFGKLYAFLPLHTVAAISAFVYIGASQLLPIWNLYAYMATALVLLVDMIVTYQVYRRIIMAPPRLR